MAYNPHLGISLILGMFQEGAVVVFFALCYSLEVHHVLLESSFANGCKIYAVPTTRSSAYITLSHFILSVVMSCLLKVIVD